MMGERRHGSSRTASTPAPPPTVWLALPAYNEADNLPPLLSRVHAAWSGRFPFHVLVVDDGSRDGTAAVAETAAQHLPVEVIRHDRNRGLAAAIRTGIQEACRRAADGDVVVTMDADNSHPPELVVDMLTQLEAGYDLVIASRFVRGGREEGVPWRRRMLSRAAGFVFKGVCPIPGVRDYTTGFRAYRAALLKELWSIYGDRLVEAQAFSVMTEILLKARIVRPRIAEVPLVLRYDLKEGASKMRLGRTLRDYARLLSREFRPRKPARPLPMMGPSSSVVSLPPPALGVAPGEAPSRPQACSRHVLGIVLLVCLAAQVAVGLLLVRSGGFWSPDSAVRFVQVESLLRSHYRGLAVPYPAQAIDPQGIYFPMGRWFHSGSAGRFYLSYLPYFSMASALFYRLLGFPGLLVIPAAAALGTVWITYRVLRRRAPDLAWAGALAVGLASPLFVYGVVFWDHTLVVLLAAGALALLCEEIDRAPKIAFWRMTAAGAVLGLGFWLRNEVYLLAVAVAAAWLYAVPRGRFRGVLLLICGAAVPALALWALNTHLVGSPFGWKGNDLIATRVGGAASLASGGAHAAEWLREKMGNAYYQLASPDYYAFNRSAVAVGLAMTVALLLGGGLLRIGVRRQSPGMIVAGAIVGVGTGVLILSGRTVVSGLLPAAPIVVLAFLTGPSAPWERFLWGTSALFCAAVIVTGTHGGMQWGPRYLLPILPPLIWLAAAAVARARAAAPRLWSSLRLAAAALAAVSLLLQAAGVDQVLQASARNALINGWLRGVSAQIIITPLEWLTLGAGGVYFEKDLMLVQTPEALSALVQHLSQQHITRWAYVPFSGLTFSPMAVARWTDGHAWRFRPVEDHFYGGLRIVTYSGGPAPP